jgi:hypothetical protein
MDTKLKLHKLLNIFVALLSVAYFGILPVSSVQAAGVTRYVAGTGSDDGDCSSAILPCRTIQYAVNQSSYADRILVAQGVYIYSASVDMCTPYNNIKPASVICFVDKNLTILGGYSTANWSTANPSVNLTVIDGQNTYRGVSVIGHLTSTTYLDMEGFTIQNGRAQGPTSYDTSGIGGGMLVQTAAVTLKDMIFKNNRAIGQDTSGVGGPADGAALRIEVSPSGTSSLLQRVTFDNNQSSGGTGPVRGGVAFGALFIYKSTVTVEDSIFTNNLAQAGSTTGTGTTDLNQDALGGAIGIEYGINITLRRLTITGNQVKGGNAAQNGGGAYGGGILVEDTALFTISDSYVANNTAIAGNAQTGGNAASGGIGAQNNGEVTIERTKILSNTAIGGNSSNGNILAGPGAGGGMYIFATRSGSFHATLKNVIVADNLAKQGGGTAQAGNGGGGGIVIDAINVDISHATIAGNHLGSGMLIGQGLVVQSLIGPAQAVVNLNYSIIADHTGGATGGPSAPAITVHSNGTRYGTLNFNRGLFDGNAKDTNAGGSPTPVGTINGLQTMLSASSAGFISPGSPNYNFHLRLGSAAKDQATASPTTNDIDVQNRPYNNVSDVGADEYWPFALSVAPGNGILHLGWTAGASVLAGGVNHFEIIVTCEAGAKPPQEGRCGQPIEVGAATNFTLTGLSNFKQYTITINAHDASDVLLASSMILTVYPSDILLYIPLVIK